MSEIKETIDQQLGGGISKVENFYDRNKRMVQIGAGAVLLIIAGFFGYRYYNNGQEEEANSKLYMIEYNFERDSFNMVLNGDPKANAENGENIGAIEFVDEYGGTSAGQKAAYMAGIAYMAKGDYASAKDYLEKFKLKDDMVRARALGLIGDCNVELKDLEGAEDYYDRAANYAKNEFLSPIYLKKLGMVQVEQGKFKEAFETYSKIKKDYKESEQGKDIEKYIGYAAAKAGISSFEY